jgi:hypothetical protein
MKYQNDAGYGHTLDLDKDHYMVHSAEDGKHHIVSNDQGEISSNHPSAKEALKEFNSLKHRRDKKELSPASREFQRYASATAKTKVGMHKSELFKAEEGSIRDYMRKKNEHSKMSDHPNLEHAMAAHDKEAKE